METRVNKVTLLVGDRGTGKTTLMQGSGALKIRGILNIYQQQNPNQKILIIDTFDNPVWRIYQQITREELPGWNTGPRRIFYSDTDELMSWIEKHIVNTVLVFEDATKFIGNRLSKDVRRFVIDSKQKNLDIYFLFHYMMAVPNDLTRIIDVLILFKTKEIFTSQLKSKFPAPIIEQAFKRVTAHKNQYYFEIIELSG